MRLLKNFRIKNKIIIIIVIIGTASTIAGSVINYFYELHNTKARLIENSVLQAKLIAENCWLPLEFGYKKNAADALQRLHAIPEVQYATLYALDNSVFAFYKKPSNNHVAFPIELKTRDYYFDGDNLYVKQPVIYRDQLYGTIYLHSNINWTAIVTYRLLIAISLATVMLLFITLFAFILQGNISEPIIELSRQMSMVAQKKDYTIQLENYDEDEIGELYSEFNNMLAEINSKQTDLITAYTALETNEQWLKKIMEKTPLPISMTDNDGNITFRNERFEKLFGYTKADTPTVAHWFQLAYPNVEYRKWAIETWDNLVTSALKNNEDIQSQEYLVTCKDGRRLNILISGIMLDNALLVTFIDITERKKSEERLQESQRKLTTLMSNMPGLAYRCLNDANWTMLFMSEGCLQLTEYYPHEIEGNQEISFESLIHRDDTEMITQKVQEALDNHSFWQLEYRITTKSGKLKWVWEQGCGVFNTSGDLEVLEGFITDITERKQTEDALKKSEAKFATAFLSSPDIIVITSIKEGQIIEVNDSAERILGYPREEALQMSSKRLWLDPLLRDEYVAKMIREGCVRDMDIKIQTKSGKIIDILISGDIIELQDGKYILSTLRDVTDRKKAEEALRESEQMFSDMASNAAGVIFQLYARNDGTTGLYYLSPKADEILGITLGPNGNDWQLGKFIHPDDKEEYVNAVEQAIAEVKDFKCEFRIITPLGEKWIQFLARPTIKENEIVFNGILIDSTERKLAEKELEKYREKLESLVDARTTELNYSLSQIKAAMNSTADGILIVNREGHIALWNQKFVDLWHVPKELLNTEIKDPVLNYVVQQMAQPDKFLAKVMDLYEHPEVISEDILYLADGRIFERYSQPQQIGDDIVGRVWSFRNITEEKQAEENLRKAKELAESANRAKSIFLANMTHEIRTPMNAVLGFAQLLERDTTLSPPSRTKVSTIIKSGEHLLGIINDILEVSRIEAGRIEMRNESVDLHILLKDLAVMFRMQAEGKGLSLTLELHDELPRYIIADLGKLRQILINLLGNAVKFTPKGSVTMTAIPVGPDRISIVVKDSGIGISLEERDMIFKPFERTRSGEQAAGGTGLGLVISREYAHSMGGEITFESAVNQGSTFKFEFHAPMTVVLPATQGSTHRVTAIAPNQGEIRILIVDDQSTNRDLLRCLLEPIGFSIDEAISGVEAIAKATTFLPRIILMDMVMPDMNGIDATKAIRLTCAKESTAIIGISASAFETEKQNFIDAGINAFIAKPFREQELFDLMTSHAGVQFEIEEIAPTGIVNTGMAIPTLEKMTAEWRETFAQALAQGSITRIRQMGEEVTELDAVLAAYIHERAALYDINGLKKLC